MSKSQTLRGLMEQRLSLAAEEIFELFERTIAEYEEQLCRSKEENERQHKLLEAVYKPEVRLHRADVQTLLVKTENVPTEQQERGPSLDREDPPEPAHIKEEEEEVWRCQETEQFHGLKEEEEESSEFTVTPAPTKNNEEGEEAESSQLDEKQTEEMLDCESETDDSSDYLEESAKPQSALNHVSHMESNSVETAVSVSERATSSGPKEPAPDATKIQKEEKPFSCSVCGKTFVRKPYLKQHMICHSSKKLFCCSLCNRRFSTNGTLKRHSLIHSDKRPHSCSVCDKTFLHKRYLKEHMVSHSGEKPHSCSVCGKSYSYPQSLRIHSFVHTGRKSSSATKSDQKKEPQNHKEIPKKERPFCCSVCDRKFTRKYILKRHMSCQSSEKPFCCSVCGITFRTKSLLRQHSFIHSGERPFCCSVCYGRFMSKGDLTQHTVVHSGERPHICSVCDKTFVHKRNLKQHMVSHSGEKPHSCSVCGKRYSHLQSLRIHSFTHTGKKPLRSGVSNSVAQGAKTPNTL